MKIKLNILSFNGFSIYKQLIYEEILLRCSKENWFLYNMGNLIPTIVLGYSGKIDELLNVHKVNNDKINVIRRYTGGGTVVVDESTIFASIIMNSKDANTQPYPRNIMSWSDNILYGPIFKKYNKSFSLREHDYVFGDLKFGGNAQSIIKDRWVHHTSFLWDYNPKRMEYLKIPSKKPEYRGERNHKDFLTTLKENLPSMNEFQNNIIEQLSTVYDVKLIDNNTIEKIVNDLKNESNNNIQSLIRTVNVDIENHIKKTEELKMIIPSLVKSGPSCTNI